TNCICNFVGLFQFFIETNFLFLFLASASHQEENAVGRIQI
ncbi:hypothetical protein DOY81_007095, partial [Sarcophaga bullata]